MLHSTAPSSCCEPTTLPLLASLPPFPILPSACKSTAQAVELTVVVEQADLSVGGHDVFKFGRGGNPRFRRQSIYHDIVPERRIVSTEIVCDGEVRLWVAATTLEFTPHG